MFLLGILFGELHFCKFYEDLLSKIKCARESDGVASNGLFYSPINDFEYLTISNNNRYITHMLQSWSHNALLPKIAKKPLYSQGIYSRYLGLIKDAVEAQGVAIRDEREKEEPMKRRFPKGIVSKPNLDEAYSGGRTIDTGDIPIWVGEQRIKKAQDLKNQPYPLYETKECKIHGNQPCMCPRVVKECICSELIRIPEDQYQELSKLHSLPRYSNVGYFMCQTCGNIFSGTLLTPRKVKY